MNEQFESTNLTYETKMDATELMRYIKAICIPLAVFLITMYTIAKFAGFGTKLLAPLYGTMWAAGAICAILMPSHRADVIKETLATLTSGVSGQMIAASFDTAVTSVFGNTMLGYINNFIWMISIIVPITFLVMQAKRIMQFRKNKDKNKFYEQIRDVRDENKAHMR